MRRLSIPKQQITAHQQAGHLLCTITNAGRIWPHADPLGPPSCDPDFSLADDFRRNLVFDPARMPNQPSNGGAFGRWLVTELLYREAIAPIQHPAKRSLNDKTNEPVKVDSSSMTISPAF